MENVLPSELDRVRTIVAASKNKVSHFSAPGGLLEAPLPWSLHRIRPVLDPTDALARHVMVHRRGRRGRTHCPDALRRVGLPGDYPDCAICTRATASNNWRLRVEEVTLLYGHLYSTLHPRRYWKPGRTHVVLMKTALAETILADLERYLKTQPELVWAMLNPYVPGPALELHVPRRQQWGLSLRLTADTFPPLALGDWYRPLTACWIGTEFNLDDYQSVLAAVTGSA